ncbi:efflux RND transporter permease subunit [Leptolyngbya sp. Heron Island J]|uniref:efflux RND transporter permease subunit n=1 Tax=Leptolyngbya sp. Heron Island J TaxID=1385935 RepID=UPI0009DF11B0|nr:efflux RND transporter permease subunit [Leptolyngbya sp. Heron Island J]
MHCPEKLTLFLALSLTPALSALLLRSQQPQTSRLGQTLNRVFALINHILERMQAGYQRVLRQIIRFKMVVIGLFIVSLGATGWLYLTVPTAFIPDEDQGYVMNIIQGPEGTTQEYTGEVIDQVDQKMLQIPGVDSTFSLGGVGFTGNIANSGISYITLKPWNERTVEESAQALLNSAYESTANISQASVFAINPPAIMGLGSVGGFVFQLQDRTGGDLNDLLHIKDALIARANQRPELQEVFSTFTANAPKKIIEIDRDRAKALQVDVNDILSTLQILIGSHYVNDFNAFNRTYRVYVQADSQFRSNPRDVEQLYMRSRAGEMIPLANLIKMTPTTGAQTVTHYNLFRSIEINGMAAPGYSSGQAIAAMEQIAAEVLPRTMGFEWSGISLEEISSSGQAPLIFGLGLIFVFLVLAAQYENFIDPLIIMLAVPLAILGALLAQSMRGLANDVYCQVGLVMLIGLASKNAILIVEFANQLREELSIAKAAMEAAIARLRPILMTALSTLIGIFPLMVATGAGSASCQSIGTAVFGGILVATFLSLFVVPVLYIVINTLRFYLPKITAELKTVYFKAPFGHFQELMSISRKK